MRDLELLSEWQFRTLYVQMSKLGYRTDEPNRIPAEASTVLRQVFEMLKNEGVFFEDVAREISIGTRELSEIVFGLIPYRPSIRGLPVRKP